MQHYLLIDLDGEVSENQTPPDSDETQQILDGELFIYRVGERGQFQEFTPIDELDVDNWTDITQ